MKAMKNGNANASYAFLLLLTPNRQAWEVGRLDRVQPKHDRWDGH